MFVQEDTPEGTPVLLVEDNGSVTKTKTRSCAWKLGDDLVVLVDGRTGGYLCSRMTIDEDPFGAKILESIPDEMVRQEIMHDVFGSKFCMECWSMTDGGTCQCWNDE